MASLGGKREGAGRKIGSKASHTLEAEKAREFVVNKVVENLEPLMEAKLDLALGHKKETPDGKVYTTSPDGNAIQYLLNQGIGKPTETLKVEEDVTLKIDV